MPINQVVEIHQRSQPRARVTAWSDDSDLVAVVERPPAGESAAWEALVQRFSGLVAAIARRCRLSEADVRSAQTTWLRLVENLDRIEQPERIGAWLATTSRRESLGIATQQTVSRRPTWCTSWPTTRPSLSMRRCCVTSRCWTCEWRPRAPESVVSAFSAC